MSRIARVSRETSESSIDLAIDLDGSGKSDIDTTVPFFDHLLTAFAKHSLVDLTVRAQGDIEIDVHHTVEDTGIVLGTAIKQALGDKAGITRFGDALVPLDEALTQAVVDISGRPYLVHTGEPAGFEYHLIGGHFTGSMVRHVFEAIVFNAGITVHVTVLAGRDPHHIAESEFKAFARAFRQAVALDPKVTRHPVDEGRALTMAAPTVVVLDYGSGNVHSAAKALEAAGARVELTADRARVDAADGLVVPGVGAFAAVMAGTRRRRRRPSSSTADSPAADPVLGICVGMQVLFERGVERGVETEGLGEWPGVVGAAGRPGAAAHRLEHRRRPRGFGALRRHPRRALLLRPLLRRAPSGPSIRCGAFAAPRLTWAEHGERFIAAVENGPLIGDPVPPGEVRRARHPAARATG